MWGSLAAFSMMVMPSASTHRNHVQVDLPTSQAAAGHLGADQAVAHVYIGPHRDEALDMLVDGAAAQVAAAGEGHLRPAEAAQQSAHQIVAGTNPAGQLVWDLPVADVGAVNVHRGAVDGADICPQLLKDLEDQRHIADLGDIFNTAHPVHQQCGGDDSDSGVFGAADGDGPGERLSALNVILCQNRHPLDLILDWGLYEKRWRNRP